MENERLLEPIMALLGAVPAFEDLPEEALNRLAAACKVDYAPRGAKLLVQGETPVEDACVVARGAVALSRESEGRIAHDLLGEGALFGGLSLLRNDGLALHNAEAAEDVFLYRIPKRVFFELCANYPDVGDYFFNRLETRFHRAQHALRQRRLRLRDSDEDVFLHLAAADILETGPTRCPPETSLQRAAELMTAAGTGYILAMDGDRPLGIVTDSDLRREAIAGGRDLDAPVEAIMSRPLRAIPHDDTVLEALVLMREHGLAYLPVVDGRGAVLGVVSALALPQVRRRSPLSLIQRANEAGAPSELAIAHARLPRVVHALFQEGYAVGHICRLIAHVNDAVLRKLIGFAVAELGEPPCPFAWLNFGSEGRQEQTLAFDQDNGILYADEADAAAERWFANLGAMVCAWLDEAGYPYCRGQVMANNPNWRGSLNAWQRRCEGWIAEPGPQAMMNASIFFDFRVSYGDTALAEVLRGRLFERLAERSDLFFRQLAENHLEDKPPIGFFRNFIVAAKGEHKNAFDIKKAMSFAVGLARLYALKHGVKATNTLRRLAALRDAEALPPEDSQALSHGYELMMSLRLHHQEAQAATGGKPDNFIKPYALSRLDQDMLKSTFRLMNSLQRRVRLDFIGI